jgi:hypothetical protein
MAFQTTKACTLALKLPKPLKNAPYGEIFPQYPATCYFSIKIRKTQKKKLKKNQN